MDLINRQDTIDTIVHELCVKSTDFLTPEEEKIVDVIRNMPSAELEIIRCKDCKHKPYTHGRIATGFDIIFPDESCPCQCEDGWYSWIPEDDWYCANAERRTDEID